MQLFNNDGHSPKDFLSKVVTYKDETGMILLHRVARTCIITTEFLVDTYRSGI
jgi:hypothetical protein